MPRLHLFEIEDQAWLPAYIRDSITDFLRYAVLRFDIYKGFSQRLINAIDRSKSQRAVDLCSGGGGPWPKLILQLVEVRNGPKPFSVKLTDFYPNVPAMREAAGCVQPGVIDFCDQSVSALSVPPDLTGFRTLFSSFHHFRPDDARAIIADAVLQKQGIAIAESTQRHPLLIAYMFLTPALVLLTSPFQKPFRWSRLFWTYVIPVVPLAVMFDGIVSCLRTYTPQELMALVRGIPNYESFDWDAGVEPIGRLPVGVTYLIGVPRLDDITSARRLE